MTKITSPLTFEDTIKQVDKKEYGLYYDDGSKLHLVKTGKLSYLMEIMRLEIEYNKTPPHQLVILDRRGVTTRRMELLDLE